MKEVVTSQSNCESTWTSSSRFQIRRLPTIALEVVRANMWWPTCMYTIKRKVISKTRCHHILWIQQHSNDWLFPLTQYFDFIIKNYYSHDQKTMNIGSTSKSNLKMMFARMNEIILNLSWSTYSNRKQLICIDDRAFETPSCEKEFS